jgi:hypothetical protein
MAKLFIVPSGEKYPDTYDRKLSDDFRSIISTCGLCGEVLKGSVNDGLRRREVEHYLMCPKKVPCSSAPPS